MWIKIFSMATSVKDFKKPLTHDVLSNPDHDFVKTMLYVYSMESFLFSELNRASRMKDTTKIKYYGAFGSALGYIIHCGNNQKNNKNISQTFFRGLQLSNQELLEKFQEGSTVNL